MKALDFEYAGRKLSSYGMILCKFGSDGGVETLSDGSEITFNTIPVLGGTKHRLVSTTYDSCLETTLQICKYSCAGDIREITATEHREITKWLNRKNFLKFKFLDENNIDLYHEAIINISKIEIDGKLMGLELNVFTNRPFALHEPRTIVINNTKSNGTYSLNDTSYEEGYIYPFMEITVHQSGDLKIHNAIEDRSTFIGKCVAGEIITMDYPVIQSSLSSSEHDLNNNFNWNFFRIANTYENSRNDLTISLPCTIKIKYSPIVKVGL